jgi:hypothetical protein
LRAGAREPSPRRAAARPVRREADELEEALQSPVGRGRLHRLAALGGDVPKVHRARADRADDEAQGLEKGAGPGRRLRGSDLSHDAMLELFGNRYGQHVEVGTAAEVAELWRR